MSYLLDVVTEDVADAIAHIGGLMFDLGRAGWHVRVLTAAPTHDRALRILGTYSVVPGLDVPVPPAPDRVVRTSAPPIPAGTPPAPHELHLHWGAPEPAAALHPMEFRLSTAAQMFKAQALLCAGPARHVDERETFWADGSTDGYPFAGCHLSTAVVG